MVKLQLRTLLHIAVNRIALSIYFCDTVIRHIIQYFGYYGTMEYVHRCILEQVASLNTVGKSMIVVIR